MISDGKISLRAPEPSDVDALFIWENDCSMWFDGRIRAPLSRHQLWQYVESYSADPLVEGQARFMIVDISSRQALGSVDLYDIDIANRRAGVGVMIAPEYRRKGYASRAIALIADYCRDALGLHQLWAIVGADNTASRNLFAAASFSVAGYLRSWIRRSSSRYGDAYIYQRMLS